MFTNHHHDKPIFVCEVLFYFFFFFCIWNLHVHTRTTSKNEWQSGESTVGYLTILIKNTKALGEEFGHGSCYQNQGHRDWADGLTSIICWRHCCWCCSGHSSRRCWLSCGLCLVHDTIAIVIKRGCPQLAQVISLAAFIARTARGCFCIAIEIMFLE